MKRTHDGCKLIFLFFLFFSPVVFGTNYYVSNSGNDGNTGTSAAQAWQTLAKVNSHSFSAGDQILLKRGDTFYGKTISSTAGRSGNVVTYATYGNGADPNPIITGFTSVTSWTNTGGNIWQSSSAVSTLSTLNTVLINGKSMPMGRYPNGDASYPSLPNFYTFQSITGDGSGASSITSSSLGATNWTGADVVIRVNQWTFHREVITSQSGTTLNFTGSGAGGLTAGWGFFIQNDVRTLDQQGEWYYNPSTKKISIYSTSAPTNVKVSTIDTLFYLYYNAPGNNYTAVDHIDFTGANTNGIFVNGNLSFSLTNSNVSYCGLEGLVLYGGGIVSGTIDGNNFYNNGSSGIFATGDVSALTITNNSVNVSGIISAYKRNDYTNGGINCNAPSSLIQYNDVDSSAYCGVNFKGANIQVKNNFVNHSAMVRGDAAGIYTGFASETGKVIDANIIMNSMGNPRGSQGNDYFAMGIYIDDLGTGVLITNNTLSNCRTAGIYLHNSNHLTVRNNTIYNCGSLTGETMWANGGVSMDANTSLSGNVHDNIFTKNTIYAITPYQYAVNYYAESGSSGEVSNFGTIDSNYYVKVGGASTLVKSDQTGITGTYSLAGWKTASSQDAHSIDNSSLVADTSELSYQYNATQSASTKMLDGAYKDIIDGTVYNGSITLAPYSSAVLIETNIPPTADAGPTQVIYLPLKIKYQ